MRRVGEAQKVRDGALQGHRQFRKSRDVHARAVFEIRQRPIGGLNTEFRQPAHDLLLGQAQHVTTRFQPSGDQQMPMRPDFS